MLLLFSHTHTKKGTTTTIYRCRVRSISEFLSLTNPTKIFFLDQPSSIMTTISEMFAEQEEDMARLNEIYQRVNERHEKMRSLMMMKEKTNEKEKSTGLSKDKLAERV